MSARVVGVVPNHAAANGMRAMVLSGMSGAWEVGPRSAAELEEAAAHFDRAAAISRAPAGKAAFAGAADACRRVAAAAM